jgi:hypothetical protein
MITTVNSLFVNLPNMSLCIYIHVGIVFHEQVK